MYVDGVNTGPYYPYTWDEAAISNPSPATVTWGSGSSAGQAHLRWNWVEFSILTEDCKRDYFVADTVPDDALVYLDATSTESLDPAVSEHTVHVPPLLLACCRRRRRRRRRCCLLRYSSVRAACCVLR